LPQTEKCLIEKRVTTMQESVPKACQLKEKISELENEQKCDKDNLK
jgi:hypothetical protein